MRLTLAVLIVCFSAVAFGAVSHRVKSHPRAAMWEQWKLSFNKEYETEVEEITRFKIWLNNLEIVEKHNAAYDLGLTSFDLEMNVFADLSSEEFAAQRLGYVREHLEPATVAHKPVRANLPESQNWTALGYVTPVKDQGQCGSCWSFSTTGSLEGQHFNATGNLVSLSEQQLVDCDMKDAGCNGGLYENAFNYLINNGGSVLESDYPYTARRGTCKSAGLPVAATLSSYVSLPRGSEEHLKEALAVVGPISVAIDASHYSFQLYKSGVYYQRFCSSWRLDHAVLAVGYGHDAASNMDYWLVKNSWGTVWGDDGYIKMARNQNNNCGVATEPVYPVI